METRVGDPTGANEAPTNLLDALNASFAKSRRFIPCLLICIGVYLTMTFGLQFKFAGLYAGDMNENLGWAWRTLDKGAFPGDVRVDYQTTFWGWPGVAAVYSILLRVLDLEMAGKFVALGLGIVLFVVAYRIGIDQGGGRAGAAVATLVLCAMFRPVDFNLWASVYGGLPRSFAYPLIWIAILLALQFRFWLIGGITILAALFYPPAALLIAGTTGLYWFVLWVRDRAAARAAIVPLACVAAVWALEMLWLAHRHLGPANWGAPPTFAQASAMPIFLPGGTLGVIVAGSRLVCWLKTHGGVSAALCLSLLLFAPLAARGARANEKASRGFWFAASLLVTSLVGYGAAYAFFFRLYLPDRYVLYGGISSAWLFAYLAALAPLRRIPATARFVVLGRRWFYASALAVCLLSIANLWRIAPRGDGAGHTGIYRSPIPDKMLEIIRSLPKDVVIVSDLEFAGDIPFRAARSVFLTLDDLFPFHMNYFETMRSRSLAQQRALFATDWRDVDSFARDTGVGAALVDLRHYQHGRDDDWSREYPWLGLPRLASGTSFVLSTPPPKRILAQTGNFVLVDLRRLAEGIKRD